MLIECPHCKARVEATEKGKIEKTDDDGSGYRPETFRIAIGECPVCATILVGRQEEFEHPEYGYTWSDAERLYPSPKKSISHHVPAPVKFSLEEADRCFSSGAFTACAVMCGRALEGVCSHHKTETRNLNDGLKKLLQMEIIDARLHKWGMELKDLRNLGAHESGVKIAHQDASDVLMFAHAISEYVFVLTQQFQEFMARRPAKVVKPQKGAKAAISVAASDASSAKK